MLSILSQMPFIAALFDLDGTLIDSLHDIADAGNRALDQLGLPTHAPEAYRQFIGEGVEVLIRRMLPDSHRDPRTFQQCMEVYRRNYSACWHVRTTLYPGIAELLTSLQQRNIRLAVLSNKPDDFVQHCARHFLGEWPFDRVWGATDRFPHKPDPTAALALAQSLGVATRDFLYLGDMPIDIDTARRASMVSVAVTWGFRTREQLEMASPDHLIDRPAQLLDLLDSGHL